MGHNNIIRLWSEGLKEGLPVDLISGDALKLLPEVDDTGSLNIGDGTTDMDVKVFLGASTDYVLCDVGNGQVTFDNAELQMGDNDEIEFGDAADVTVKWNASNLQILPATDDTGAVHIGDGTTDMDFKWFGSATTKYVEFNMGDVLLKLEDVDLRLGDNDILQFGDATNGDITVKWDGTDLLVDGAAADTIIKIGATNNQDIYVYGATATNYVLFNTDDTAKAVTFEHFHLELQDASVLRFGDSDDITMTWDATDLLIDGAAANTVIKIGATNNQDLQIFGATATNYVLFDTDDTAKSVTFEHFSLDLQDDSQLRFGDADDVTIQWNATNLLIQPATTDTGILMVGNTTGPKVMDLNWYVTSTAYASFDVGDKLLKLEDIDLKLGDNDILELGDAAGGDVRAMWNGTNLVVTPAVTNTGAIHLGEVATPLVMDLVWNQASGNLVTFSVTGQNATFEDIDVVLNDAELTLGDSDSLRFGDGTGGDVAIEWNATYLQATSLTNPMWTACPSPMDPNFHAVAYEIYDDFTSYDNTATTGDWTLYEVGTGTDALDDVTPGGVLLLTCQATTDDACEQINHNGAAFKLAAGKTLWFECRFKLVGDVEQSEVSLGLINAAEDLKAEADVLPNDGISFSKQDATAAMALTCSKDGTNTGAVAAVHTLVNNTWTKLGFLVNGVTSVTPYVNGVAGTAATATICDDELLTPYLLVRNGDGTTQEVLHVDYVKCVQLR